MSASGGSSTSHLHDEQDFRNTGDRVANFGGGWTQGLNAGAFFWGLPFDSSNASRIVGSRLQIL